MLVSAVTSRFLDALVNYHLMVVIVLVLNGWVAGWMVHRLCGSVFWAGIAQLLITMNSSTALNMSVGHLHALKYCWVLLAAWAYCRYVERPGIAQGIALGLSAALVLQGSFYAGYFLTVGLGFCWVASLLAGRLDRRHLRAAGVALLSSAVVGIARHVSGLGAGARQCAQR